MSAYTTERRVARHRLHLDSIRCDPPAKPYGTRFLHDPDPEAFLTDWEAYEYGDDDWEWMADLREWAASHPSPQSAKYTSHP